MSSSAASTTATTATTSEGGEVKSKKQRFRKDKRELDWRRSLRASERAKVNVFVSLCSVGQRVD